MRIFHILNTLANGDGVGNDTRAINNILVEIGYRSRIYAEIIVQSLLETEIVQHIGQLPQVNPNDLVIYHFSIGCKLDYLVKDLNCKKIMIYHNITPPEFFMPYDAKLYSLCQTGIRHIDLLKDVFDYCLADSEFNKQDLINAGYTCPIDVLPILVPFHEYDQKPDPYICDYYADKKTNILFTGRIAPNKKQENIIQAFSVYKNIYDPTARLFLVGGYDEEDNYYKSLKKYIEELGVKDVVFSGHISFPEILAYFSIADLFLCMSEHEGFCIPLLEAMYFNIPVIAYSNTAIPYTMKDAGLLLQSNDAYLAAAAMNEVQTNFCLRKNILKKQQLRLKAFSYEKISTQFKNYFTSFVEGIK